MRLFSLGDFYRYFGDGSIPTLAKKITSEVAEVNISYLKVLWYFIGILPIAPPI